MTSGSLLRVAAILLLAAVLLPAIAAACPLCKDARSDTDYPGGTASLPKGFYYSILLMVSAPFVVMGGLLLRIHLSRKRGRVLPASAPAEQPKTEPVSLLPDPKGMES